MLLKSRFMQICTVVALGGASVLTASDIDVTSHVKKYWTMQIYSLRSFDSRLAHARREYIVRDCLVNTRWRPNGVITAFDNATAARIDKVPQAPQCYPHRIWQQRY